MDTYVIGHHLELLKSVFETPDDENFIGNFREKLTSNQLMTLRMIFREQPDRAGVIATLRSVFSRVVVEFCGLCEKESNSSYFGDYFLPKIASFCELLEVYNRVMSTVKIKPSDKVVNFWKDGMKFCLNMFTKVYSKAPECEMMVEFLVRHWREADIKVLDIFKMFEHYNQIGAENIVMKLWKIVFECEFALRGRSNHSKITEDFVFFLEKKRHRFLRPDDVENVFDIMNISTDVKKKIEFVRKNFETMFPKKMSIVFLKWLVDLLGNVHEADAQRFWNMHFTQIIHTENHQMTCQIGKKRTNLLDLPLDCIGVLSWFFEDSRTVFSLMLTHSMFYKFFMFAYPGYSFPSACKNILFQIDVLELSFLRRSVPYVKSVSIEVKSNLSDRHRYGRCLKRLYCFPNLESFHVIADTKSSRNTIRKNKNFSKLVQVLTKMKKLKKLSVAPWSFYYELEDLIPLAKKLEFLHLQHRVSTFMRKQNFSIFSKYFTKLSMVEIAVPYDRKGWKRFMRGFRDSFFKVKFYTPHCYDQRICKSLDYALFKRECANGFHQAVKEMEKEIALVTKVSLCNCGLFVRLKEISTIQHLDLLPHKNQEEWFRFECPECTSRPCSECKLETECVAISLPCGACKLTIFPSLIDIKPICEKCVNNIDIVAQSHEEWTCSGCKNILCAQCQKSSCLICARKQCSNCSHTFEEDEKFVDFVQCTVKSCYRGKPIDPICAKCEEIFKKEIPKCTKCQSHVCRSCRQKCSLCKQKEYCIECMEMCVCCSQQNNPRSVYVKKHCISCGDNMRCEVCSKILCGDCRADNEKSGKCKVCKKLCHAEKIKEREGYDLETGKSCLLMCWHCKNMICRNCLIEAERWNIRKYQVFGRETVGIVCDECEKMEKKYDI